MKTSILVIGMCLLVCVSQLRATSLVVSDVPAATDAGQIFEVGVEFSTSVKNTNYYLLGVFFQSEGSNSFGKTINNSDELVDSTASASSYYLITTDDLGHWQGKIEVVANTDDSGFKGQGDYYFKVNRYTGKSANTAESSNVSAIKLMHTPPPTPMVTPSPTPAPSATPTPVASPSPLPSPSLSPQPTSKPATPRPKKVELKFFEFDQTIASDSSQSASSSGQIKGTSVELPNTNYVPILLMIGGLSLAGGVISLALKIWPT